MLDAKGEPFVFSAPWVAKGYGCDENPIRRGKYWLERNGYLTRVGQHPSRHGKPLWP